MNACYPWRGLPCFGHMPAGHEHRCQPVRVSRRRRDTSVSASPGGRWPVWISPRVLGGVVLYVSPIASPFEATQILGCTPVTRRIFARRSAAAPPARRGVRVRSPRPGPGVVSLLSRFGRGQDTFYRFVTLLERLTFALADVIISTNDSYAQIAAVRGRRSQEDVFVVRSAPDLREFRLAQRALGAQHGKQYLLAYVGRDGGPQDGVDHPLRALAAARIAARLARDVRRLRRRVRRDGRPQHSPRAGRLRRLSPAAFHRTNCRQSFRRRRWGSRQIL